VQDQADMQAQAYETGMTDPQFHDVIIIGGGQMGLSLGYYLHRASVDFAILDAEPGPGGAWRHGWDSLRLFSPARIQLASRMADAAPVHPGYPTRNDVLDYLGRYEARYALPVQRPVRVDAVERNADRLDILSGQGRFSARVVVSATGTWSHPISRTSKAVTCSKAPRSIRPTMSPPILRRTDRTGRRRRQQRGPDRRGTGADGPCPVGHHP
jgi:glycine/D-amino acid oxidase-like deaminating enzyme